MALYTFHPERLRLQPYDWAGRHERKFGPVPTHSAVPGADYEWPETACGGGSAWGARKMAAFMGFELVILVGCPLTPGPYVSHWLALGMQSDPSITGNMADRIEADRDWHEGALSMSGRTKEILG